MKLKDLIEQYGEYEVTETKGDWRDACHVTLELNKPKPKTVWDLEKGDKYFVVCYNKSTYTCDMRTWGNGDYEKAGRETGILFLTKEETEQDHERRVVETLLLKHGGRRWFKYGEMNWLIYYDRDVEDWRFIYSTADQRQGAIYFDTKEEAEKAIEEIGDERIRKALFEVR